MYQNDDLVHKLDLMFAYIKELMKSQQDIFTFLQQLETQLRNAKPVPISEPLISSSEWIDAYEVKALLHMGDLTLRRRRQEGAFVAKKIGKKWFYLRSSLQ